MIRSDKDILAVLSSSLDACAIYDSADLRISYASTNMLKLWNCDHSAIGQYLENCLQQEELTSYIPLLKNVWGNENTQLIDKIKIKLKTEQQSSLRYTHTFEYHPLINEKGEIYAIFNQIRLIPENEDDTPQTQEKNTIERKLLQNLFTQK